MKNTIISKQALAFLIVFFVIVALNSFLLFHAYSYGLLTYFIVNSCFAVCFIILYRKWFSIPLENLTRLNKATLGTDFSPNASEIYQATKAIQKLNNENTKAHEFVKAIGNGNLDADVSIFGDKSLISEGSLGAALLRMREQLRLVAEKEKERTWTTEGLASFSELLRNSTDSLPELCNIIVSKLTKYIDANQAAIFILNNEDANEPYLERVACYAYGRRKHIDLKVAIGEGLLGQAYLEQDSLYLTDIPDNYTHITSGLGGASPKCILIVPIMLNKEVHGVLEIATFKTLLPYQVEFVEKLGEGIASSISSVKIKERTSKLLIDSQEQTQMLRSQEEEMRQHLEELQATQEAGSRMQEELKRNEILQQEKISELDQARQSLLEQEAKLKASNDKAQKRSLLFKEKMEQLDIELEGKNAEIKKLKKQLEEIKNQENLADEINSALANK